MVFSIERHVAAPVEAVWAAWTRPEDIERWYSPGPMDWIVETMDVRPGGRFRMHMDTPEGQHVAEGTYMTVEAPHHLVQGPDDGSMTIDLVLESDGAGTRMLVTMPGLPEAQHAMMKHGWSAGFDKLDALLAG